MTIFVKCLYDKILNMNISKTKNNYAPGRGEGETTRGVYDGIDVGPCFKT